MLARQVVYLFCFALFSLWENITKLVDDEKTGGGYWSLRRMVSTSSSWALSISSLWQGKQQCSTESIHWLWSSERGNLPRDRAKHMVVWVEENGDTSEAS